MNHIVPPHPPTHPPTHQPPPHLLSKTFKNNFVLDPRPNSSDAPRSETQFALCGLSRAPARTRFRQQIILRKTLRILKRSLGPL